MSTVSTEEIAAVPPEVEQETKGTASPESDPVSVMVQITG